MSKVLIVGAFGFEQMLTGGQPVKTRELYYLLCREYGEENIEFIETKGWKKNPLKLVLELYRKSKRCGVLIMLPAHNGVEIFGRIFAFIKKITGKKIFYDVIGGWLPDKLSKEPGLLKLLKEFDGIWVETTSMKTGLNNLGMNNVTVVPNFKKLTLLKYEQFTFQTEPPFRLCTFSRVMKEKGIEDAINAVKEINERKGKTVYTLDIYGHIDEGYAQTFEQMQKQFPEYIKYCGCVSPSSSVETLKDYFALLFPTRFYTEGIPGTIIDAYAAGIPVIAPLWLNYKDVFEDGVTGLGYEFKNYEKFVDLLYLVSDDPDILNAKKENCLMKSADFTDKAAFRLIKNDLDK